MVFGDAARGRVGSAAPGTPGAMSQTGPSDDPAASLEHEADRLEHHLDELGDHIDDAKKIAAARREENVVDDDDADDASGG